MNFDKVIIRAEQLHSLALALESSMIENDCNNQESRKKMQNLFYVVLEQIEMLNKELEELSGHIAVCNAVFAVNRIQELKDEIEQLKKAK